MTLTCEDLVTYLSEYLEDELDTELVQAAEAHLATCDNCRVVLDSTRRTIHLYRQQGEMIQLPTGRKQRLFDHIEAAFERRQTD